MDKTTSLKGAWTTDRLLAVLEMRNAISAVGGRPVPMAALVVARIRIAALATRG